MKKNEFLSKDEVSAYLEQQGFILSTPQEATAEHLRPHLERCATIRPWTLAHATRHNVEVFIPSCHADNVVKRFCFHQTTGGLAIKHWSYTLQNPGQNYMYHPLAIKPIYDREQSLKQK